MTKLQTVSRCALLTIIIPMFAFKALAAEEQSSPAAQAEFSVQNPSTVTAKQVYLGCKNYFEHTFRTQENVARKAACNGFFFGAGSALRLMEYSCHEASSYCLPDAISTEQLVTVFFEWVEKNEVSAQTQHATKALVEAVTRVYPCKIPPE